MAGRVNITFEDLGGERSPVGIYIPDLGAGNIAAYENGGASLTAIQNAISGISDAAQVAVSVKAVDFDVTGNTPGGFRELKALFTARDTVTGKLFQFEIPAVKSALIVGGSKDKPLDSGDAAYTAVADMFTNGHAVSPAGNAATLVSGRLVGRNI